MRGDKAQKNQYRRNLSSSRAYPEAYIRTPNGSVTGACSSPGCSNWLKQKGLKIFNARPCMLCGILRSGGNGSV